jgi:hypothetical protein
MQALHKSWVAVLVLVPGGCMLGACQPLLGTQMSEEAAKAAEPAKATEPPRTAAPLVAPSDGGSTSCPSRLFLLI